MTIVHQRRSVLLVDDSPAFLRAAARWLHTEPCFALAGTACSGEDALEAVLRLRPDIVLMDLAMPGMGGLAATRAIKQRPDAPLVIVISLHDSRSAQAEAIASGADAFIGKSNLMSEFAATADALAVRGDAPPRRGIRPGEPVPERDRP